MSDHQGKLGDIGSQVSAAQEQKASHHKNGQHHGRNDPVARIAAHFLDNGDSVIYAVVGVCFLVGGLIALGYAFWDFADHLIDLPLHILLTPAILAGAIIQFVSDLLLVLIIMEVLGTVTHYLQSHTTSLRPFLFIGIVSATRGILSIGAKLSVETSRPGNAQDFTNAMIELGVNAAVILALGITLKLLGKLVED
ncbi:MAG TPA: phosphate-starvation-inducible PsiE family protein [Ktedonobacteraceae bacterium]|nr:phosphate-starvation-inducible PsiE family protein [Ktedonobacteraceae bacterium]